jgi:anti-anti-sigma factor
VELLVRATGHTDDITLLAAQRVEPSPDLELALPAEPASLRASRLRIAAWLGRLGVTEDDAFRLQHALGELLTNAIEHGSAPAGAPGPPMVALHARLGADGCLEARITDQGRWREPARRSARGRGLALTSQLVDDMRVEPTAAGTVATLRHSLTRPSRMLHVVPAAPRSFAPTRGFRISDGPGSDESLVRVEGPVDADTAESLRRNLLHRGRGGTLPLIVDLAEVTHLASAGVSALHRVAEKHGQQGGKLTLLTVAGSPAQQILALVAIPNVTLGVS